jgi:hypothetical protein
LLVQIRVLSVPVDLQFESSVLRAVNKVTGGNQRVWILEKNRPKSGQNTAGIFVRIGKKSHYKK